jgi:hypothetical protein
MNTVSQVNVTRNQSTAVYTHEHFFLFNNKYQEAIFENDTGGTITALPYSLVTRDAVTAGTVNPMGAATDLPTVVGILATTESIVDLVDAATINVNYCTQGDIAEELIELPGGVTLDTVQGGLTTRDYLFRLGFHLVPASTEHTKSDNV